MRFETFTPSSESLSLLSDDTAAHPEDVFVAAIERLVRCSRAERSVLRALACEALDQADGPDGDFAALDVDRWLAAIAPCARKQGVSRQRVRWLASAALAHIVNAGLVDATTGADLRRALRDEPRQDVSARIVPALSLAA